MELGQKNFVKLIYLISRAFFGLDFLKFSGLLCSTTGDVYIIPDYSTTRNHHPAQILVLPFVPHPSNTITNVPAHSQIQPAPPPHYFYTGRSTTPLAYHDPPPDYETLTNSCSCTTQLTTIADDYGKYKFHSGPENLKKSSQKNS